MPQPPPVTTRLPAGAVDTARLSLSGTPEPCTPSTAGSLGYRHQSPLGSVATPGGAADPGTPHFNRSESVHYGSVLTELAGDEEEGVRSTDLPPRPRRGGAQHAQHGGDAPHEAPIAEPGSPLFRSVMGRGDAAGRGAASTHSRRKSGGGPRGS